ncbi:hypothetical protein B0H17DRAFT_1201033 [Mycena rosella]|uniref:Uncharacterized protein n=1 Tax=Mycena rosella TaxID=1033263 RepID=A0AAD7DHQ0_MYCRO|nr:hypothetical protein B0H17DRAFT_1201033 [Mycena rosella]
MTSSFTNENIDPQLLALDPTQILLARIRNNPTTADATPEPPLPEGGNREDAEMLAAPLLPTVSSTTSTPSLVVFGRLVKRKTELSDSSSVAFDQFCQVRCADERQVLIFTQLLELADLARRNEKASTYALSPELTKKIGAYVKAFVFSPTTTAYRGLNVGEHIMKAMQECKVKDLPDEEDTIAVDMVLDKIRDKGTHHRNIFKTKSMEKKSTLRNVAVLTHKLLKNSNIKPTVQSYQQTAFIRWCIQSYPVLSDEEFWLKVDSTIATFRTGSKCSADVDKIFTEIYESDKKTYGDPTDTDYKTVDAATSIPQWQVMLRKQADKVQPTLQSGPGSASKKRRIEDEEGDDSGVESVSG